MTHINEIIKDSHVKFKSFLISLKLLKRLGHNINHRLDEIYDEIHLAFDLPEWYILVSDESGHDYVIPQDKLDNWEAWVDLDSDDPESWDAPDYAERVEGNFRFRQYKD